MGGWQGVVDGCRGGEMGWASFWLNSVWKWGVCVIPPPTLTGAERRGCHASVAISPVLPKVYGACDTLTGGGRRRNRCGFGLDGLECPAIRLLTCFPYSGMALLPAVVCFPRTRHNP